MGHAPGALDPRRAGWTDPSRATAATETTATAARARAERASARARERGRRAVARGASADADAADSGSADVSGTRSGSVVGIPVARSFPRRGGRQGGSEADARRREPARGHAERTPDERARGIVARRRMCDGVCGADRKGGYGWVSTSIDFPASEVLMTIFAVYLRRMGLPLTICSYRWTSRGIGRNFDVNDGLLDARDATRTGTTRGAMFCRVNTDANLCMYSSISRRF